MSEKLESKDIII